MEAHLQRKSIRRRPSDKRPVDLPKKVRPLGRSTGKPSPAKSPPVSELESPKLKITGGFLHWAATGLARKQTQRPKNKNEEMKRSCEKWRRWWCEAMRVRIRVNCCYFIQPNITYMLLLFYFICYKFISWYDNILCIYIYIFNIDFLLFIYKCLLI